MRLKAIYWLCLVLMVISVLGTACAGDARFVKLTRSSQTVDFRPAWSPDGSQIAYWSGVLDTSDEVGGPWVWIAWGIFVMHADGSSRRQLANLDSRCLSWSPSGDEIVFSTSEGGIGIIGVYGGNLQFVIPEEPGSGGRASDWPSYSPDGTKILFSKILTSESDGITYWQILLSDVDGTDVTRLSPDNVNDFQPAWSPDGDRIAFSSDRDGDNEIYVMNAAGSGVVRLTDDTDDDSCPVWSPDGSRIAFISTGNYWSYKSYEVYVMNSDGSNVVRLTNNSIKEVNLSWSPDGTTLAICGLNSADYGSIYLLKMV